MARCSVLVRPLSYSIAHHHHHQLHSTHHTDLTKPAPQLRPPRHGGIFRSPLHGGWPASMRRHLLQPSSSAVNERLAAAATPAPGLSSSSAGGVDTDTFLILVAVLCLLVCVAGLAVVARCWRLCNHSVDAEPAMPPCRKGLKKKALRALPTVPFVVAEEGERPECAICLAEFARGDEVRVLPPCGHRFHAACVDVWLLSSSTCPSCRRAVVVAAAPQASTGEAESYPVAGRPCRTSVP